MTEQLNIKKYDRQIRTYGLNASNKITQSTVYLYGLEGGLGTEVGKNITLKRGRPRARGRFGKLLKPFSELTIKVRQTEEQA